jgi:hypothetical protein
MEFGWGFPMNFLIWVKLAGFFQKLGLRLRVLGVRNAAVYRANGLTLLLFKKSDTFRA